MLGALLSPFCLLFFIIILGFALGRIRVYKISLGIAGVLFAAIAVGALMAHIPTLPKPLLAESQNTMKIFSKLGSSLFVSVLGLQTGISIKGNSKGSLHALAIGIIMSISGVVTMTLISALDRSVEQAALLGGLCGALTSTPALSSVCETIDSNDVVLGYGVTYLSGVCLTVLFSQILSSKDPIKKEKADVIFTAENRSYYELVILCIVALVGTVIGTLKLPFLNTSIGSTTTILAIGLMFGSLHTKVAPHLHLSTQKLNTFKILGLTLFFTGTGYSTGMQSISLDWRLIIYGIAITLSSLVTGVLLCKLLLSKSHNSHSFIIAGGMTSSPAYGIIEGNSTDVLTGYFSFAYFGALIALITSIQIIIR